MKLVYVYGDDYSAMQFEQSDMTPQDLIDMWADGTTVIYEPFYLEFEVHEFENVDKRFISFIRNKIQDYDQSKHSNFYIIDAED